MDMLPPRRQKPELIKTIRKEGSQEGVEAREVKNKQWENRKQKIKRGVGNNSQNSGRRFFKKRNKLAERNDRIKNAIRKKNR